MSPTHLWTSVRSRYCVITFTRQGRNDGFGIERATALVPGASKGLDAASDNLSGRQLSGLSAARSSTGDTPPGAVRLHREWKSSAAGALSGAPLRTYHTQERQLPLSCRTPRVIKIGKSQQGGYSDV